MCDICSERWKYFEFQNLQYIVQSLRQFMPAFCIHCRPLFAENAFEIWWNNVAFSLFTVDITLSSTIVQHNIRCCENRNHSRSNGRNSAVTLFAIPHREDAIPAMKTSPQLPPKPGSLRRKQPQPRWAPVQVIDPLEPPRQTFRARKISAEVVSDPLLKFAF